SLSRPPAQIPIAQSDTALSRSTARREGADFPASLVPDTRIPRYNPANWQFRTVIGASSPDRLSCSMLKPTDEPLLLRTSRASKVEPGDFPATIMWKADPLAAPNPAASRRKPRTVTRGT